MKSSRSRLIFDAVLVAGMFAVSFPAEAPSLRVLAGIYALLAVLANTVVGRRARVALDLTFALFVASMAWYELLAVGYYMSATALYAAIGGMVAVLAIAGRVADTPPAAA